nr:hypothetical protein [Tanacetum cinerariifolium]
NKFVLIVLNDGHASLLGYTMNGTHPRAVRYGINQSDVKKLFYFCFDDVMDFWIYHPLTLHFRRVVFFENAYSRGGGSSLSSTSGGSSSLKDGFFGSTTLRSL